MPTDRPTMLMKENPLLRSILRQAIVKKFLIIQWLIMYFNGKITDTRLIYQVNTHLLLVQTSLLI